MLPKWLYIAHTIHPGGGVGRGGGGGGWGCPLPQIVGTEWLQNTITFIMSNLLYMSSYLGVYYYTTILL